jgi:hypothetical protein
VAIFSARNTKVHKIIGIIGKLIESFLDIEHRLVLEIEVIFNINLLFLSRFDIQNMSRLGFFTLVCCCCVVNIKGDNSSSECKGKIHFIFLIRFYIPVFI